ncbi:MAG: hypothetical protein KKH41_00870 [Candidatus Thermoplasmatota archaeon]|nr:hypothetical protein [Euryarchaeota archaeon]MBU4031434.1 hypothetical protein [Candidatus Thermoplasmatota archaeon]MBU4144981.1 hypothetical protein [Candidatus Thermoplasmatota archaeon]MBU4591113.1 hypothetical protein [Candidatus Thermoplasmatota archaeon]
MRKHNNAMFWSGAVIFFLAALLSYSFPVTSLGLVYFLLILTGITMLISSLVIEEFHDASEAKVGKGIGIFNAIMGIFALGFAAFLMVSLAGPSLRLMDYNMGFLAVALMWVLFIGLFLVGVSGILSYFNGRKYKRDISSLKKIATVVHEWEYTVPNPDLALDNVRFKVYDFGFSIQTINAIFLKGEYTHTFDSIEKIFFQDASKVNKRLAGYIAVFVCKKGVDTYDYFNMPSDVFNVFKSYLIEKGINIVHK